MKFLMLNYKLNPNAENLSMWKWSYIAIRITLGYKVYINLKI